MTQRFESFLNKKAYVYAFIFSLALLVYCNSFTAPFTLDDFGSIVNNKSIRNPLDVFEIWKFYSNRFVLYFTLAINYRIHDTAVAGYHVANLLIHIFSGMLVFLIIRHLLSLRHFEGKIPGKYPNIVSLVCALLFISHPIQVNAVTYIVQRTASLAAMFYFLAVYFFIKFRIFDKKKYFVLTMLFTVTAMFTKENTITIPFLLIVTELMFFMKDGKTSWKKRILFIFILLLTVPIIPGTNLLLKGYSQSDPNVSFKASTSMDRFHYFYTQMNVIIRYIQLLVIPDKQNFDYSNDFPLSKTIWENHSYVSFIILLIIGLIALLNVKKNKLLSFGIIWFFIGLSVESSFISIKDVYFEHRLYFPVVGYVMCLMGVVFIDFKKPRFGRTHLFKKPLLFFVVLSGFMLLMNSALTLRRNYIYSDGIRLWSDVVEKAPKSDRAHSVLAANYLDAAEETKDKGKRVYYLDLSEKEFKKAIELRYNNDTAHTNFSRVYFLKKEYDKSISEARIAIGMSNSVYAYRNLGLALKEMGKTDEALKAFLDGYKKDSKTTFILSNLGDLYYEQKDYKNARKYYEEYLKIAKNKVIQGRLEEISGK